MDRVEWARDLARRLLAAPLPRRWEHTRGVGRAAESLAHILGEDAETLACAAWLHDIGYAPTLAVTGFHPLDGARYLRDVEDADERVCRLVANHSFACIEARNRSLDAELSEEFPDVNGLLKDALTYCDMTTSPDGDQVDVEHRLKEILIRYDENDVVAAYIREARRHIASSVRRVSDLMSG